MKNGKKKAPNPIHHKGRKIPRCHPNCQGHKPLPSRTCYKGQTLRFIIDSSQSGRTFIRTDLHQPSALYSDLKNLSFDQHCKTLNIILILTLLKNNSSKILNFTDKRLKM
jgi:hypothetical protein